MEILLKNLELVEMLLEIDENGEDLTDWEKEFVSNLVDEEVTWFTPKQERQIRRIHEEKVP